MRSTLHWYRALPYVLRLLYVADMMIGAAMWNAFKSDGMHVANGGTQDAVET